MAINPNYILAAHNCWSLAFSCISMYILTEKLRLYHFCAEYHHCCFSMLQIFIPRVARRGDSRPRILMRRLS
ncbi:hypothetical protein DM860_016513 [Cuscuta australis]|uniref:Uncharacterized protein n=1 Tax=Cuscuta australis TaxID=267555 RepID=A0A328E272_9ASTE|nr:hypothetical protein DM860_016513 [Cuscuta australis]